MQDREGFTLCLVFCCTFHVGEIPEEEREAVGGREQGNHSSSAALQHTLTTAPPCMCRKQSATRKECCRCSNARPQRRSPLRMLPTASENHFRWRLHLWKNLQISANVKWDVGSDTNVDGEESASCHLGLQQDVLQLHLNSWFMKIEPEATNK